MTPLKTLIIDDEKMFASKLAEFLSTEGYNASAVYTCADARSALIADAFNIVFIDIKLPDGNGLALLEELRSYLSETFIFVMTAYADLESAIKALRTGAFDLLLKPVGFDEITSKLLFVKEFVQLKSFSYTAKKHLLKSELPVEIIGESPQIKGVIEQLHKVAPYKTTVLIQGESGCGKELVAQAIHKISDRANSIPITVNCAAIPEQLFESEFFGHTKGAFTGATENKAGYFQEASGSSLILDEIGEIPYEMQSKMLRAFEQEAVSPVGSVKTVKTDARIICMTNRDLLSEVRNNKFRNDLYHRISMFPIFLPPLRERKGDIPILVEYYIRQLSARLKKPVTHISDTAMRFCMEYNWPGNVRELINIIERAIILAEGSTIETIEIPGVFPDLSGLLNAHQYVDMQTAETYFASKYISSVLTHCNKNKEQTAQILNISLSSLYKKIKELNLE